jgi:hypothetical protein
MNAGVVKGNKSSGQLFVQAGRWLLIDMQLQPTPVSSSAVAMGAPMT